MTKTENLSLPQWVGTDQIQRKDFNEAFAALDTACADAVTTAHSASETAEAIAAVAYTPDNKPYCVGTYTGNGSDEWQDIELGFQPSFVLITRQGNSGDSTIPQSATRIGLLGLHNTGNENNGQITTTGFQVRAHSSYPLPQLNTSDKVYDYIAFR